MISITEIPFRKALPGALYDIFLFVMVVVLST